MILFQDERVACEPCIRGHRAATCHHLNKPLVTIRSRGKTPDKRHSIRLKLADFPKISEIVIKNGKKCFIINPNTPCCLFKADIKKKFNLIEPIYHINDLKINFNNQNITLLPPSDESFRCGISTIKKNNEVHEIDYDLANQSKIDPQLESDKLFEMDPMEIEAMATKAMEMRESIDSSLKLMESSQIKVDICNCTDFFICDSHIDILNKGLYDDYQFNSNYDSYFNNYD